MSTLVTLHLPDEVMARAEAMAQRTGQSVADLLAEAIQVTLPPVDNAHGEKDIQAWADADLLAAAGMELLPAEDQRLSVLLDRQQANPLSGQERSELAALMLRYQEGLLRKAQALREAVRRGLRPPLQA